MDTCARIPRIAHRHHTSKTGADATKQICFDQDLGKGAIDPEAIEPTCLADDEQGLGWNTWLGARARTLAVARAETTSITLHQAPLHGGGAMPSPSPSPSPTPGDHLVA